MVDLNALSIVADIVTAGAVAVGAVLAWRGLSTWRDELIGRRKTELAEDVLSDFYQASELIRSIRSPMSFPESESKTRESSEDESDELRKSLNAHFVPIARIEKHEEFFGAMLAKRYRMKAHFGSRVDLPFDTIGESLHKINVAAAMMMNQARRGERGTKNQKLWDKWESTIWHDDDDADAIAERVNFAVVEIEQICGPVLEGKKT